MRYGFGLLWYLLLVVFLSLFLHWVAAGASSWLERSGSRRRSHRFLIIGFITIASVFFSHGSAYSIYSWMRFNRLFIMLGSLSGSSLRKKLGLGIIGQSLLMAPAIGFYFPFVFIFIWAFPLSAWFWQNQAAPLSSWSWAFLDPHSASVPSTGPIPLRPGLALAIGLLGGFIACIPYVPFVLNLLGPSADRISHLQSFLATNYPFSRLWLSQALIGIIIAGIVSKKIKPFGWAQWNVCRFCGWARRLCRSTIALYVNQVVLLSWNCFLRSSALSSPRGVLGRCRSKW